MENKISNNFKNELTKQFAMASAKNPDLNSIEGVKSKSDFMNSIKEKKEETNEKWSEKYKKGIDCNNPKGFSQRAHCQGKKKKIENKEATSAGSAGGFVAPLFGKMKMDDVTIYHKTTYDMISLTSVLKKIGFGRTERYGWRETEHAHIDDHSQAYLPHMDKENGSLISLNIETTKI